MPTLAELEAAGSIEQVADDAAVAANELAMAETHLTTAAEIAESDAIVAYTALYDATRKAISAHMRARGYRATSGSGHHAKTMSYAQAALAHRGVTMELSQLHRMRRLRNSSEYDAQFIPASQVRADLEIATAIVQAVTSELSPELS
jgi:hypothetical protein